jgi:hypothetical protein
MGPCFRRDDVGCVCAHHLPAQLRDPAACFARVLPETSRPLQSEGAGNAGRPMRPIAACAEVVVESTRVSQVTPESPGIPAQWFTAYFVLSPATGLSCHRRRRNCFHRLDASVGASGPHDFAVRLSAVRYRRISVHRIPPRGRDDRVSPLCGTGRRGYRSDLGIRKTRIFLQKGLDRQVTGESLICPSGKSNSPSGNRSQDGLSAARNPSPSQPIKLV